MIQSAFNILVVLVERRKGMHPIKISLHSSNFQSFPLETFAEPLATHIHANRKIA